MGCICFTGGLDTGCEAGVNEKHVPLNTVIEK